MAQHAGRLLTKVRKQRCVATSRRSGERCKAYAVNGTTVCYMHGAHSPNTLVSAELAVLDEGIRARMAFDPDAVDPWASLKILHRDASAVFHHERDRVMESIEESGRPDPALMPDYLDAGDRLGRWATKMIKSKHYEQYLAALRRGGELDARKIALVLGHVVDGVLAWLCSLGMTHDQEQQLRAWAGQELRAALDATSAATRDGHGDAVRLPARVPIPLDGLTLVALPADLSELPAAGSAIPGYGEVPPAGTQPTETVGEGRAVEAPSDDASAGPVSGAAITPETPGKAILSPETGQGSAEAPPSDTDPLDDQRDEPAPEPDGLTDRVRRYHGVRDAADDHYIYVNGTRVRVPWR